MNNQQSIFTFSPDGGASVYAFSPSGTTAKFAIIAVVIVLACLALAMVGVGFVAVSVLHFLMTAGTEELVRLFSLFFVPALAMLLYRVVRSASFRPAKAAPDAKI